MKAKVTNYLKQAEKYLSDAETELEKRDLRQASEKYWGAASQAVKAYAEFKGCKHTSHTDLFRVIDKLVVESKDGILRTQFGLSGMLHINFYEGWLSEETIKQYGGEVKELVDKIKAFIHRNSIAKRKR